MAKYRVLLIVEEDNGESSVGDELVDFTETIGWSDDLKAVGELIENLLTPAIQEAMRLGITLDGDWDHVLQAAK